MGRGVSGGLGRVYLLGDSITQGLGSKRVNFENELSWLLGEDCEVVNLALTGTTIDYSLHLLNENKIVPSNHGRTVCVVLYGNVDAQIRPNHMGRIFPHIPKRYQGGGMLMPRPFYSRSLRKSVGQHLDNAFRKALAFLIKAVDGTEQWVTVDSFSDMYGRLLENLQGLGLGIVCCSCVYIDEVLFRGSPEQYELFNERIRAASSERELPYVDLYDLFRCCVEKDGWDSVYNKDHFHPNGRGYQLMARAIAEPLLRCAAGEKRRGDTNE